jgi:hypothetical protein
VLYELALLLGNIEETLLAVGHRRFGGRAVIVPCGKSELAQLHSWADRRIHDLPAPPASGSTSTAQPQYRSSAVVLPRQQAGVYMSTFSRVSSVHSVGPHQYASQLHSVGPHQYASQGQWPVMNSFGRHTQQGVQQPFQIQQQPHLSSLPPRLVPVETLVPYRDPKSEDQIQLLKAQLVRAYAGFEMHLRPLQDRIEELERVIENMQEGSGVRVVDRVVERPVFVEREVERHTERPIYVEVCQNCGRRGVSPQRNNNRAQGLTRSDRDMEM